MIFLAIQNTYDSVELGLYNNSESVATKIIDKIHASRLLIPELQSLLAQERLSLTDLSFVVANKGPGPFTTLRVVISSINGLSFSLKIPLIGICSLTALIQEIEAPEKSIKIALLNAFNGELYFSIADESALMTGCKKAAILFDELNARFPYQSLYFIGNGVTLYLAELQAKFGSRAILPNLMPQTCALDTIARLGLMQWQTKKEEAYQLIPFYLKNIA